MRRLATIAATALAILLTASSTALCQGFCSGAPCYAQTCGQGCVCIQPQGPGSEGFCNAR